MALSGTINGVTDNSNYSLTCEWSATQNITNNTSTITAKIYLKAPSGWSTDSSYWDCTINGTQVTNDKSAVVGDTNVLLGQKTWTVTHTSSGTCSTTISFSYSNGLTSAGTYTTKKGSGSSSITLNTIPRTSSFTLSKSSMDMGASQTVNISRASSSFTHTVQYTFGGSTTTLEPQKTTSTSVSFTPPISLANKIPNATSGTCTVKVTTYNGDTSIGSVSKTFTLTVPSSVKPTVALATTINNGLSDLMLSGKSTIKITPTGTGNQGSTISSYTWSGAGLSGTGSSKTTGTLNAGSYTVTVTVKDSRGRTNSASTSFTVYAYSAPTCSVSAYRTDPDGTANSLGGYVRLKLSWNLSNPNSANTNAHTYKIEYKTSSDTTWRQIDSGTLSPEYSSSNTIYNPNGVEVSTTTSYNFRLTVTDSFGSTSAICTLSTINALLNLEKNGVGIGKIYERGKLDINGNVYIQSGALRFTGSPSQYARLGYSSSTENDNGIGCTFIANGNNNWLRLNDDKTITYGGYPVAVSTTTGALSLAMKNASFTGNIYLANNQGILCANTSGENRWTFYMDTSNRLCLGYNGVNTKVNADLIVGGGNIDVGTWDDSYNSIQFKRSNSTVGGMMTKIGASWVSDNGGEPAMAIETGLHDGTTYTLKRRYRFASTSFTTDENNTTSLGTSGIKWTALYATNGTIQTSDGRYKYILEDVNSQTCYDLIKDMNLYGYSTLNKRIDEYTSTTEISDELQESSQKDMNLHMGFVAQEIKDSELAKYILIKDELEDGDGNKTNEHIYGVDNYAYTTAIHGALQHEIKLREKLEKEIEDLKQQIKKLKE